MEFADGQYKKSSELSPFDNKVHCTDSSSTTVSINTNINTFNTQEDAKQRNLPLGTIYLVFSDNALYMVREEKVPN